jgi:hypothetical protein
MVNFPVKASASIADIYTPADGIYSLRDQRRLLSGTDWPPPAGIGDIGSAVSTLDILGDGSCVSCLTMETGTDLNSSNSISYVAGGINSTQSKYGSNSMLIDNGEGSKHIAVNQLDLSSNGGSYSISAWFRLKGLRTSGIQPVLMMIDSVDNDGRGAITVATSALAPNSSDRRYGKGRSNAVSLDTGGSGGSNYDSGVDISQDQWYHGLHVYDHVADTYTMYLDNVSVKVVSSASSNGSQPPDLNNSSDVDVLVGHEPDSFDPFGTFDGGQSLWGYVDQVRIFDKALNATEVGYVYEERLVSSGSGGGGGGGSLGDLYSNTNSYTFSGTQSSPTNLSSGISAGTVADFDLQFDIYTDQTNGNNEWVIQNNAYYETNGLLVGYYNTTYHGIAIAGDGIGAYGFDAASNLPTSQTVTVRVECRFSSAGTISVYHNGSLEGSQGGYTATGVNWDYLYLGMGRSGSSGSWSSPFKGTISNIYISSA